MYLATREGGSSGSVPAGCEQTQAEELRDSAQGS